MITTMNLLCFDEDEKQQVLERFAHLEGLKLSVADERKARKKGEKESMKVAQVLASSSAISPSQASIQNAKHDCSWNITCQWDHEHWCWSRRCLWKIVNICRY
jgi:hypothetical protein